MKRKTKKILLLSLAAMIISGLSVVSANAAELANVNFSGIDDGDVSLSDLSGVEATDTTDVQFNIATVTIGGDTAKVLRVTNNGTADTTVKFPFISENSYELNNDDLLCVEYDFFVEEPTSNASIMDFGTIGIIPVTLRAGGAKGYTQYNIFYNISDSRNLAVDLFGFPKDESGNKGPLDYTRTWCRAKFTVDYEAGSANVLLTDLTTGGNIINNVSKPLKENTELSDLIFKVRANAADGVLNLANIKIYSISKMRLSNVTPAEGAEGVFPESNVITAEFSNAVDTSTLSGISVYANGIKLSDSAYSVASDGKTITLTFADPLDKSTTYKIDYSGIKDSELGQFVIGTTEHTFRTEEEEGVLITDFRVIQGLGDAAAAGNVFNTGIINGAEVTVKNKTDSSKNISIIYAIYSAEKKLVDTAISYSAMDAGEETVVTTGLQLNSGGFVKIFTWDGITTMKPWTKSVENSIN